ncbi:MAG: 2-hydroxychromene-2-carboxylate isomerase [Reyranella sp.]|jgi:2-hydroxychromene-2-carboxylate isomerase|nr:2-hydroxychromene-2-carboxylate isomerase [Reyranella sp.]
MLGHPKGESVQSIEYFYAAHSAFAYLGSARFMAIAAAAGRKIVHKPVDLRRVVAEAGAVPFGRRSRAHAAYFFGREIERWSEQRGVPWIGRIPTHHANDIALPNGMLIAGLTLGLDIDGLAHALLEAHWRDDADLADRSTLAEIGQRAGIDPAPLLDAALSADVQAIYQANTEEAIRRSVFGAPTYFVDGDMFYGQDRLEMVERALATPYAGKWPRS